MVTDEGNNGGTFLRFLKSIMDWHLDPKKTIYILDNATYHKSLAVKTYIREKGVMVKFLPPSSSVLNPVEL